MEKYYLSERHGTINRVSANTHSVETHCASPRISSHCYDFIIAIESNDATRDVCAMDYAIDLSLFFSPRCSYMSE